jgi:hypothetical protein
MIVRRFRSVGWVGCVTFAALGCYLVSQRVASERAHVEQLDRRILMARIDIRKLETELGTRSRLPVLEQWNRDVLALSAPGAGQYLHGEVQLARFEVEGVRQSPIVQASVSEDESVAAAPRASDTSAAPEPMLRHANYVKPADGAFAPSAREVALLDEHLLADLQQTAQREKRGPKSAQ